MIKINGRDDAKITGCCQGLHYHSTVIGQTERASQKGISLLCGELEIVFGFQKRCSPLFAGVTAGAGGNVIVPQIEQRVGLHTRGIVESRLEQGGGVITVAARAWATGKDQRCCCREFVMVYTRIKSLE